MTDAPAKPTDRRHREDQHDAWQEARQEAWGPRKPESRRWTVAVDLTTTLEPPDGTSPSGAKPKMQKLEELAARTKGSGVTIVAQELVPAEDNKFKVERYAIEDGRVKLLSVTPSKGTAGDLQDLVHIASHSYQAKQMGLIVQSHGNGDSGISTYPGLEGGAASPDRIQQAIAQGLHGSSRQKLDVLDFDACKMGTLGVLGKMGSVAKDVVASAELEGSSAGGDGQNLRRTIGDLLESPSMRGSQWADKMVADSRAAGQQKPGEPFDPERVGTLTLAHFDMAKVQKLTAAVGKLGSDLAEAVKDPTQKAALEKLIASTPEYGTMSGPGDKTEQDRDLKAFLTNLKLALAAHKISDPRGILSGDVQAAVKAEEAVVRSYYGSKTDGAQPAIPHYDQLGGIGIFLPGRDFPSAGAGAPAASPLDSISRMTAPESMRGLTEDFIKSKRGALSLQREHIAETAARHPEDAAALAQVLHSLDAVAEAKSAEEFTTRAAELHAVAIALQSSKAASDLIADAAEADRDRYKQILQGHSQLASRGWTRLIGALT